MRVFILILAFFIAHKNVVAQKVLYSNFEKEDTRYMNFEIIGKVGQNVVVYKNARTDNYLSFYNADMTLNNKVKLKNLPAKLINADFVAYNDYFYMIYQHQKKNILYCESIKYDAKTNEIGEPVVLDTTNIPFFANDNKIYSVQVSDNKQNIAIFKGNKKNEKLHNIGIVLFDAQLKLKKKKFYSINMDGRNNYLDQFKVDNDADLFLAKCYSTANNDYLSKFDIIKINSVTDSVAVFSVPNNDRTLDEIKFKIDNANKKLIAQSFYFSKRRGNVEGIALSIFDKSTNKLQTPIYTTFSDSFRIEVNGINNLKMAFNDFFIKDVFVKKDGSFITTAECLYSTTRGSIPNTRWDYFSSTPYLTSYDYYNMGARNWNWNNSNRSNNTTYSSENIAVMSFSKNGILDWSNVIHKSQREDGSDDYISHQVILTGGAIHFLFNDKNKNDYLLNDNSVSPTGVVLRLPTLKNLNRQYQIMPSKGKQTSAKEIVFPCLYKNFICFAKLEY
jgi:hypothetical protein